MSAPKDGKGLLAVLDGSAKGGGGGEDDEEMPDSMGEGDSGEGPDDAQLEACQEFLDAVTKGDATALYHAFTALKESC